MGLPDEPPGQPLNEPCTSRDAHCGLSWPAWRVPPKAVGAKESREIPLYFRAIPSCSAVNQGKIFRPGNEAFPLIESHRPPAVSRHPNLSRRRSGKPHLEDVASGGIPLAVHAPPWKIKAPPASLARSAAFTPNRSRENPPLFPGYSVQFRPVPRQKLPLTIPPRPASPDRQRLAGPKINRAGDQPKPHLQDTAFGGILLAVRPLPWKTGVILTKPRTRPKDSRTKSSSISGLFRVPLD